MARQANRIEMKIGEAVVQGWTSVSIFRSIENVASQVNLGYQTDAPGNDLTRFPFEENAPFSILSNGITVVDGYIDDIDVDVTSTRHSVSIRGRSRGGQIADCSAYYGTGTLNNSYTDHIIRHLLDGYDVELVVPPTTDQGDKHEKFSINVGESVFSAAERAARERGLMLIPDEGPTLTLAPAGSGVSVGSIDKLANIISHSRKGRFSERFSFYLIHGKYPVQGKLDDLPSKSVRVTDAGVPLFRVKIISGNGSEADLRRSILWERNVRAGRSRRFTCEVDSWHQSTGPLWVPDTLLHYKEDAVFADDELLISSVRYSLTEGAGDTCTIEMVNPAVYDSEKYPTKRLNRTLGGFEEHGGSENGLPEKWTEADFDEPSPPQPTAYTKQLRETLGPVSEF